MLEERQGGLSLLYTEKGNAKLLSSEEMSKGNRAKNCFIDLCQARWHSGEEPTCTAGDTRVVGFDPWVGKIPWSRKSQPTPIFLSGESPGQRSLAIYGPWDCEVERDWAQFANTLAYIILGVFISFLNFPNKYHTLKNYLLCNVIPYYVVYFFFNFSHFLLK